MLGYEACKYCKDKNTRECDSCTSSKRNRIVENARSNSDDSDFLTSAIVAGVTGSTLAGLAVGGDLFGSMLGDSLFGDD